MRYEWNSALPDSLITQILLSLKWEEWGSFESLYVICFIMIFTVFNHDISLIYRIFLVFLESFRVFACLGTFETYLEILEHFGANRKLRWRNELGDQIWRWCRSTPLLGVDRQRSWIEVLNDFEVLKNCKTAPKFFPLCNYAQIVFLAINRIYGHYLDLRFILRFIFESDF